MADAGKTVTVRFRGDSSDLKRASDEADRALGTVTNGISKMNDVAKLAAVGVLAAGAFIVGDTLNSLTNIERLNAQTTQTIKSMNAQWTNTQAITQYASKIEHLTSIEAEQVQTAQNLLLTFGNIRNEVGAGNDIFDQATSIVADMSIVFGTDMSGAAIQLGKALNDPIKGITALSRVGVSFSEAQKEQIKNFVEAGDVASAQKVILAELTREVGGAAEAFGDTTAGKVNKLKNEFGDLSEELVVSLMPALNSALDTGREWVGWLSEHDEFTKNAVLTLGGLSVAVLGVNAAVTTYKTVVDAAKIATELWTAATIALDTALTGGWLAAMGPIALALGAIVLGIYLITKGMEGLGVTWGMVWDVIWGKFINGLRGAKKIAEDFWKWITEDVPAGLGRAWDGIWNGPVNQAVSAFNWIARQWNNSVGRLSFDLPGVGHVGVPQISYAAYRAAGGNVTRNRPYWVGERGPELFYPGSSGRVESSANSNGDVYVMVEISQAMIAEIARVERVQAGQATRMWVKAANGALSAA